MHELLKKYRNHVINEETQQKLNTPLKDGSGFNEGHEEFLKMLVAKLESGALNSHDPASLFNHAVYDKLNEEEQEKTSLTAINIMSLIRQIEGLWNIDNTATFQIQNLVESVFQMKAKFEALHGDVFDI